MRGLSPASAKGRIRVDDYLKQLARIKRFTLKEECDFLVIAGDVFHSPRPRSYVFDEFAKFVGSLTAEGVQIICIAGTHDQPRSDLSEAYIKALEDAGAPNFHFFRKPGVITLRGCFSGRKVRFLCLPYLRQAMLKPMEYIRSVERTIERLLAEPMEPYDYTVAVGHLLLEGATVGSMMYKPVYAGEAPLPLSLFHGFDAAMMGHIHTHQFLTDRIVYSGSIERVDFGEEGEEKGFVCFRELDGGLHGAFVKLPCRPMLTIPYECSIDLRNVKNPESVLRRRLEELNGVREAILRIRITLDPSQTLSMNVLDEILSSKGVFHWVPEIERVGLEAKPVERGAFNLEGYFRQYLESLFKRRLDQESFRLLLSEGLRILKEEGLD